MKTPMQTALSTQHQAQWIEDLKSGSFPSISKILVPTDLSEHSSAAFKYAVSIARKRDSKIFLLHVSQLPAVTSVEAPPDVEEMMRSARYCLDKLAQTIPSEIGRELIVRFGVVDSSRQIVEEAYNIPADLIVITTHGYRGIKRIFYGSLAETVVRCAPCPVLVVPPAREISYAALRIERESQVK